MFSGEQPDAVAEAMASFAAQAVKKFETAPESEETEVEPVRNGARVADLIVGDLVHRFGSEFGKVVGRAHEVNDVETGIRPTVSEYVTIQWGVNTSMRYTDETLEWYGVQKVTMPKPIL